MGSQKLVFRRERSKRTKTVEELVMMKTDSAGLTENKHYGKKAKGDLRKFASVPTQFCGTYASHLPS